MRGTLDVLIRKHKSIKSDLGVTVVVPGSSEQIAETVFEGALFREMTVGGKQKLFEFDDAEEGRVLFFGGKFGLMDRWPASRVIAYLGRTSYSLFLIHFPVLVVVSTVWAYFDWSAPSSAVFGLVVAYAASLLAAHIFHHAVETPAIKLSHRFS